MKKLYVELGWGARIVLPAELATQAIELFGQAEFVDSDFHNGTIRYVRQKEKDIDFKFINADRIVDKEPDPPAPPPSPAAPMPAIIPAPVKSVEVDPGDIVNQALRHSMGYEADPQPEADIPF
jgi:hypothetical protein